MTFIDPISVWGNTPLENSGRIEPFIEILGRFFRPGEVVGVQLIEKQRRRGIPFVQLLLKGYFDDPSRLVWLMGGMEKHPEQIYITLNPLRRDLLWVANNTLRRPAFGPPSENDVIRRSTLLVKFEPTHPNADLRPLLDRARGCCEFLSGQGWPEPVLANSDFGVHLLYALGLPCDAASTALIYQTLTALAEHFSDDVVRVATNAYSAVLWSPLYGLSPRSAVLHTPTQLQSVGREQLEEFAASNTHPVPGFRPEIPELSALEEQLNDVPDDCNGIVYFLQEKCLLNPDSWSPTGQLHDSYKEFCNLNGLDPLKKPHFAKELVSRFNLTLERRRVEGTLMRGVRGIELTPMTGTPPGCPS